MVLNEQKKIIVGWRIADSLRTDLYRMLTRKTGTQCSSAVRWLFNVSADGLFVAVFVRSSVRPSVYSFVCNWQPNWPEVGRR